jgi:hypothetical protein
MNPQARREVIGQVIDYLAALTDLTVDELNQRVGGKLKDAIDKLTEEAEADEAEESEFDRVWRAVGTNLRTGQARLVVALDEAPPSLERIFRFLARNSHLDVRLVTVQKYTSKVGDVFVPRTIVNPPLERDASPSPSPPPDPRFLAVIEAYDSDAPANLRTTGILGAVRYVRYIRPPGWPREINYNFWQPNKRTIVVQLQFTKKWRASLADCLADVAVNNPALSWRPKRKLKVEFPIEPKEAVVKAMKELIETTKEVVTDRINEVRRRGGTPATE